MTYTYPFTEHDSQVAHDTWGANCGPNSLAFALQRPIGTIRGVIPDFEAKRYTSPTMMGAALEHLGAKVHRMPKSHAMGRKIDNMFNHRIALVRIQWTGPWTAPGANAKWAYRQTHWICAWELMEERGIEGRMAIEKTIFDCNGGIRSLESWEREIVPALLAQNKRADGGWLPTRQKGNKAS